MFDALRPYWYPVALSDEVRDKPVAATLLGERVVVYRASDGLHALKDLCIHRGTPLSLGWIDGETLVCAYHGWGYAGSGACVRIPSLPPGRDVPPKAKVDGYEAAERFGLIWIALERPKQPIPSWDDSENPAFRTIWTQYRWKANAARAIENVMDFAHFPWVHPGVLGDRSKPVYPEIKVETDGNLIKYVVDDEATNAIRTYTVSLPLTLHMHVARRTPGEGAENVTSLFFMARPIADRETHFYFGLARNFGLDQPDQVWADRNTAVTEQDRVIVEAQRPEELPLDLSAELHLRGTDAAAVEYRRALKRLGVTW
ncbi:MAG TPA: aromatic ring-hydroxylating dioxygenase subunit alpha [Candidatus Limnocylindria bacterium]